ncbi:MAG: SxtJ family membrane protein [Bacteriovoracia bacterium]
MSLHRAENEPKSSDQAFGLVMGIFFTLLGLLPWWRHGSPRLPWLWVALAFVFLALVKPSSLGTLHRLWLAFGRLLQRIVSPVALGAVYFFLFTPFGLVQRFFRQDPLRRKTDPGAPSYWIPREGDTNPGVHLNRQF